MDPKDTDSTYLQRVAALKLLRENMYYSKPGTYGSTDFIEDFPGKHRGSVGQFNDVIPSLAIINRDPDIRATQIKAALKRIQDTKQSKSALGKEILNNTVSLGIGSIPTSLIISTAINLMGFRKPWAGKFSLKGLRSPVTPIHQTKKLFTKDPTFRKEFGKSVAVDTAIGAGMMAGSGAVYPILAHNANISDKSMADAAKIMQDDPYITSLPVADMLAVIEEKKSEKNNKVMNRIKNVGIGAGAGALVGGIAAMTPALFKAPGMAIANAVGRRPIAQGVKTMISNDAKTLGPATAGMMGAVGATTGAFTNNIVRDENENYSAHTV